MFGWVDGWLIAWFAGWLVDWLVYTDKSIMPHAETKDETQDAWNQRREIKVDNNKVE